MGIIIPHYIILTNKTYKIQNKNKKTLQCGWRGYKYKPSINKTNIPRFLAVPFRTFFLFDLLRLRRGFFFSFKFIHRIKQKPKKNPPFFFFSFSFIDWIPSFVRCIIYNSPTRSLNNASRGFGLNFLWAFRRSSPCQSTFIRSCHTRRIVMCWRVVNPGP